MRTVADIVARYRKTAEGDFLGWEGEVLLPYLPFDVARAFLKPTATAAEWGDPEPLTREHVLAEMREYMAFAWGKVEDHRGISASRSVEKMALWLWLLGDEPTRDYAMNGEHYAQYGAPILLRICQVYGFPIPTGTDITNMAAGKPCHPGCDNGCGD